MQVLGGGHWNLMSEGLYRILLLAHALRSSFFLLHNAGPDRRRLIASGSCSLSSACLLAGRHEVKEICVGRLVQQSEHC